MPDDRVHTFTLDGSVTPEQLNDIQDDYLERFQNGETEWVGVGAIASRPAASAVPGRGWLDTDGTEWRSDGETWRPVGGRLPHARLLMYYAYSTSNLYFDTWVTDRLTYDQATRTVRVPVAGRYLITVTANVDTYNNYSTNTIDLSLLLGSGHTPPRTVRLGSFPGWQTGEQLLTYQTTADLVPAGPSAPATVQANLTFPNNPYNRYIYFAEMNVLMLGA